MDQLPGKEPADRIEIKGGKLSPTDDFDLNRYANNQRTQFLNDAFLYNLAWDYARTRGATPSAAPSHWFILPGGLSSGATRCRRQPTATSSTTRSTMPGKTTSSSPSNPRAGYRDQAPCLSQRGPDGRLSGRNGPAPPPGQLPMSPRIHGPAHQIRLRRQPGAPSRTTGRPVSSRERAGRTVPTQRGLRGGRRDASRESRCAGLTGERR